MGSYIRVVGGCVGFGVLYNIVGGYVGVWGCVSYIRVVDGCVGFVDDP
jgi:hypothetical protein